MSKVGTTLALSFSTYVLLLLLVVGGTVVVLRRQHDDGLLINLSGRQRMLTQRMTHQLMTFAARDAAGLDATDARNRVHDTMRVFETTLESLYHGGPAPIDLHMASFRECPAGSADIAAHIESVQEIYGRYQAAASEILDGSPAARAGGLETVTEIESELLSRMDSVVVLLQREAEEKVQQLYWIQGFAIVASIMLTLALLRWVQSSVTRPLESLKDAAEEMSLGNLHKTVPQRGSSELRSLAASFERLRMSLRTLMQPSGEGTGDEVSDEMADW